MKRVLILYLFPAAMALIIYQALNQNIKLTLKPYVFAIYILYQMRFEYIPGLGYREVQDLFMIGRDCLGGKLFVCLFGYKLLSTK